MATIRAIRTEEDYETALARVAELMDTLSPPEGQVENDNHPARIELDVLTDLVEHYEDRRYPIGTPSAIAAIEFEVDQRGLTQRDLIPLIGSRAKVSEILSGKRDITMSMARSLHRHLGIPADVLLQEPGATFDSPFDDDDARRFPLKQMAKLGWIKDVPDLVDRAEELIGGLIERAGGREVAAAPLYRKNDHVRINAKTDEYALRAWCWQAMAQSRDNPPATPYRPGTVTRQFLRTVARLSTSEDGPRRARSFLDQHGIALEHVPHLRRTHLDGAALRLVGGRPVVGLTLRYDRIDSFWFTLLHELAHVGLHLDRGDDDTAFIDDHSLRDIATAGGHSKEEDADRWAEDALIPPEIWNDSVARFRPSSMAVVDLSYEAAVHPAIVAGRIRHEQGNYRLLSQFVGTGEVRKQFEPVGDTD